MDSLSYDRYFIDMFKGLQDGAKAGQIHSVFKKVINFLDGEGNMFSIGVKEVDNAPYTLRIDSSIHFKDLNFEHDGVYRNGNGLIVGNVLFIEILEYGLWTGSYIEKKELDPMVIASNIEYFNKLILNCGGTGGAKYFYLKSILGEDIINPNFMEKELSNRIVDFIYGVYEYDIKVEHLNRLIGFGLGLTPSGDDFLVGFLTALRSVDMECANYAFNSIGKLIHIGSISTTDVSKQMIRAAMKGQAREYILKFTQAFFKTDRDDFLHSYENMLKIGSTSGMDISIGIAIAFHFILDRKNWRLYDEKNIG
ncbi:MAG TPA: DUF2877 domain-containing protein [Tepidimicrobium sp.]|nr:DUF2877 domain-containing protein [Tepidimicrobium sp.]